MILVLAGCEFGDVVVADPPPPPPHASVFVRVRAEEPEATNLLGWSNGLIPEAEVALVPEDTGGERIDGLTGPEGAITFSEVPLGRYRVHAVRPLTVEEFEIADREMGGFAGMRQLQVDSAQEDIEVLALTSHRRGIVLSEYYDSGRYVAGTGSYQNGGFLELYNNSDSTVYLDRLVVGVGFRIGYDYEPRPCSMFQHLRNDPAGVWTRYFHQFPGSGSEFALEPGEVVVVATMAIDHGEYLEGEPDLSEADYEFAGGTDNPAAPDLPSIGLAMWPGPGLSFSSIGDVPFIAHPAEIDQLPLDREPDSGREYVRFPAERVIEVGSFLLPESPLGHPPCAQLVHHSLDRGYGVVTPEEEYMLANERRVLLVLPDGRAVLQDTEWSGLDFRWSEYNPGTAPDTVAD